MSQSDTLNITAEAGWDAGLASELVGMATLANQSIADLFLPGDWKLVYSGTSGGAFGGCQYFLAAYPGAQPSVCALIVGAPWSSFISYYTPDDNHLLTPLGANILGHADDASIAADTGFVQMYAAIRTRLWADIAQARATIPGFAGSLPLVVAGLGPGAPVAQLAALDLRPGKSVAPSQVTALSCYVFSCPPAVNPAFATFFGSKVAANFRVLAGADQFPSQPLPASGYVTAGVQQSLPLKIPVYDSPWAERDGPCYQQLLGNAAPVMAAATAGPAAVDKAAASAFDPMLAFAMAQLCAVAYQMFQHPGSSVAFHYGPYVLQRNIVIGGVVWASVFDSPDHLVLALRGTVSWQELYCLVSNAFPATPDWISPRYGRYAKPLVDLYASGRDQLAAALNQLGDKPVLLTGHDSGGALANLMAVDLLQHPLQGARTLAGVYTFGSPPAADPVFAASYAAGALAGINFQVVRPMDIVPRLPLLGFLETVGTPVALAGGDTDPYNGSTAHALLTYLNLLDPES